MDHRTEPLCTMDNLMNQVEDTSGGGKTRVGRRNAENRLGHHGGQDVWFSVHGHLFPMKDAHITSSAKNNNKAFFNPKRSKSREFSRHNRNGAVRQKQMPSRRRRPSLCKDVGGNTTRTTVILLCPSCASLENACHPVYQYSCRPN
jgi:hypothetical protein